MVTRLLETGLAGTGAHSDARHCVDPRQQDERRSVPAAPGAVGGSPGRARRSVSAHRGSPTRYGQRNQAASHITRA